MAVLKGPRLGGKAWQVTPPPPGTPPSQVGGLSPGTATAASIPVTYTAATGSPTIIYAGWTSPQGANIWTLNGGTFTAGGGTFTGLAASTTYDLRIVATNSYGSSTTDYLAGVTTAASGSAPSQVGSVTPGSPTPTTIPVTYAAASGTAPITYSAYVSLHGAGSWTFNGSLTSTGGLFTGLSPSTTYDLRVVATNSYGSSTTDYTAGVTTAAAPPVSLSGSRYDIVPDKSGGPVGTTGTATIYPNAAWAGNGSKSITLSGTGVSFPNGASVIIPSSGTTALTVAYSISATGELSIGGSNTGGLADPYPAPFNAFGSAAGAAQTISSPAISVNKAGGTNLDLQPFQRDTASGNPTSWATTFGKGWGEVFVTLTLGSGTLAIYAKLIDADSSGATTAAGTGSYLQSTPVQVYGLLGIGARTIRLLIPASNKRYYLELATDSAWTNPVRLPQRFMVGVVVAFCGPSQQCGMLDGYAYSGAAPTGVAYTEPVTMVNTVSYYPTVTDANGSDNPVWFRHDNTANSQLYGTCSSAMIQEFARLVDANLGVFTACVGTSHLGTGADSFLNNDGSLASVGFTHAIGFANNKFRYLWFNLANGAGSSFNWNTALAGNPAYMAQHYPACAVLGYNTGTSGALGNGSAVEPESSNGGWSRFQQIVIAMASVDPRVVSLDEYHWNSQYGGHMSMASRIQSARASFRELMDRELIAFGGAQALSLGPVFGTATLASGSRVIRLPYKHHGGAALSALAITTSAANGTTPETYTYGSTNAAGLASLFAVYGPGGRYANGQAIQTTGAAINTANAPAGYDGTIDITLAGSTGIIYADNSAAAMPGSLLIQYAADFFASQAGGMSYAGGQIVVLMDDQLDSTGSFGRHFKPAVDIAVAIV